MNRLFSIAIGSGLVLLLMGELFAKFYLGLGNPALSLSHPTIEYLSKPNQNVSRFGNNIIINAQSMRSSKLPKEKSPDEFRVLVFGDSVIHGGNLIDQSELATTQLQQALQQENEQTFIGNVSSGSWGPGNWLAYAQEFGWFESDVIVLVLSSHDYTDNPSFEPLSINTHPTQKPKSAMLEAVQRYLSSRKRRSLSSEASQTSAHQQTATTTNSDELAIQQGTRDLQQFLTLALSHTDNVLLFHHWERGELDSGTPNVGFEHIQQISDSVGLQPISLAPYYVNQIRDASVNRVHNDYIHLNAAGQNALFHALMEHMQNVRMNIRQSDNTPQTN